MGKYDDITEDRLQEELRRLSRIIHRLDEEDRLLENAPGLLRLLGEMRRMIFAWEVRATRDLAPDALTRETQEPEEGPPPDSLRVVQEALERERELQDELRERLFPGEGDDPH